MSRYRVGLEDLDKRDPERRLKALRELAKGPKTRLDLSALWSIDETTSYRLLKRLYQQGFVDCNAGRAAFHGEYSITDKGLEKLKYWEKNGVSAGMARRMFVSKVKKGLQKHLCPGCLEKFKKLGLIEEA